MKYIAIIFLIISTSCTNSQWKQAPSGLQFKIAEHGNGPLITMGATVKIHYRRWIRDSTVYNNYDVMPEYVQLIPGLISPYGPQEVLLYKVHEGDSVVIVQRGDSLVQKGILSSLRKGTTPRDEWMTGIRVEKVFINDPVHSLQYDSMINADKMMETKKLDSYYKTEGPKHIAQYLQQHHITANPKIFSGTFSAIADTSKKLLSLQIYNLKDQMLFAKDSLLYQLKRSGFPPALDTSIAHYSAGSHLRYYLPAMEAFGPAAPPGIRPYSDLIFDVQIR